MHKVLDISTNNVFDVDFTILKRMPSRGELITLEGKMYEVVNFNNVMSKEKSYIVVMVKPK